MVTTMLVLSRQFKAGSKLCVRAFSTTTSGTTTTRAAASAPFAPAVENNSNDNNKRNHGYLSYSTTTSSLAAAGAQVDEDLDTALDELLASTFEEDRKTRIQKKKVQADDDDDDDGDGAHHMKNSKPVPFNLVAEVSNVYVGRSEMVIGSQGRFFSPLLFLFLSTQQL